MTSIQNRLVPCMHEWIDVRDRCHAARDAATGDECSFTREMGENVISTRTIRVVAMTALISAGILTSGLINAPAPALRPSRSGGHAVDGAD